MDIFEPIEFFNIEEGFCNQTTYTYNGSLYHALIFLMGHNRAMQKVEPLAEEFDITYWKELLTELGQRGFDLDNIWIYEEDYYDFYDRGNNIIIHIPFTICHENCGCYLEIKFKNFNVCEFDGLSNYYQFALYESMNHNWIQDCSDFINNEFPLEPKVVAEKIERCVIDEIKTEMAVVLMDAVSQVFGTNYEYYNSHREEMWDLGEYLESLFSDFLVQRFIDLTIDMKEDDEVHE